MLAVWLALCQTTVVIPTAALRPVLHRRAPLPLASHAEAGASADSSADAADAAVDAAIEELVPAFAAIDRQTEAGLRRLLDVFRRHGVGAHHFAGVDGYGHGDLGREALDSIYAELLGGQLPTSTLTLTLTLTPTPTLTLTLALTNFSRGGARAGAVLLRHARDRLRAIRRTTARL